MAGKFVGRLASLCDLKERWKQSDPVKRIFGIYGAKSVGKTRYVIEFLNDLSASEDHQMIVSLDFRVIKTFEEYLGELAKELKLPSQNTGVIVQSLRDRKETVILHHDHQELAKVITRTGDKLSKSDPTQESLWDTIYQNVIHSLLRSDSNVRLVISSTDVFKFAELRKLVWDQTLEGLNEEESLELLGHVCSPEGRDSGESRRQDPGESWRHIVRLCDGVPSAIINVGLVLKDGIFTVDEVVFLMIEHILTVLSDECLPNTEKIDSQLLHRWNNLTESQMDNLMKSLEIIKHTSQCTLDSFAKLFNYKTVAEYKLDCLLPLLRRNLLSYNMEEQSVAPCPLIQHILEAVPCVKKEKLRRELQAQIKAILEPPSEKPNTAKTVCITDQKAALAKFHVPNGDHHGHKAKQNTSTRKEPVESNDLIGDDCACAADHRGHDISSRRRQNSFVRQNLDSRLSEKEKTYEDKNIRCDSFLSSDENASISNNEQSQQLPDFVRSQDNGDLTFSSDKVKNSENHKGPEVTLSVNLSTNDPSEEQPLSNGGVDPARSDNRRSNVDSTFQTSVIYEAAASTSTSVAISNSDPNSSDSQESDSRDRVNPSGVDDSSSSLSSVSLSVIFRVVDLYLSWK